MARTLFFTRVRRAIRQARLALPDASAPGPRAITRRAALVLLAATAACSPRQQPAPSQSNPIGVVGGGTSGLVVAWRLANAGLSTAIYESSGRTGGRMFTLRNFTPEGQFCELGGELVDSNHSALVDLCAELGLSIQRLRPADSIASDLYDIDGRQYLIGDLLDPASQTGAFLPIAARIAADQAALLDANGEWTARARELDALPLSDYLESLVPSTDRWVIDLLAIAYHGEYGIPVDQQSSLNLVDTIGADAGEPFSMFGDSDEAHRIQGGSATLPETLTARLSAPPLSDRATFNLRHELVEIARSSSGFNLTFKTETGGLVEKSFERLVLALPFTRLREVKGLGGLGLSAEKMRSINELGYGVNSKLMVGASSRPWNGALLGLNAPLTGTIYSDRSFQVVWDTSAGQEGLGGVLTNFLSGAPALSEESVALAALQKSLRELSPELADALTPEVRASFFWPNHPHTKASYSGAKVGQYTDFFEHAGRTELGGRLFFAGEHASLVSPGFMNGAVEAGERVAKEILAAS